MSHPGPSEMGLPVRHAYGPAPEQWGEFAVPTVDGDDAELPPLVVNLHGGFWHADHDLAHARPFCAGLRRAGWATLNLEYRRVGHPGGGWPGTFDDVVAGLDLVRRLGDAGDVDADRVVVTGHSAGGHLALWLAGATTVALRGVVAVAAVTDLVAAHREELSDRGTATQDLLGGLPEALPERYRDASPVSHVPLPMPVVLVHGELDTSVPLSHSRDYVAATRAVGGRARLLEVAGDDHFAVLDPASATFAAVAAAVGDLLARDDPPKGRP